MGPRQLFFSVALVVGLILNLSDIIAGDLESSILPNSPNYPNLRTFQTRLPDVRPRLSSSQQQQILSDVQQHHQRQYEDSSGHPEKSSRLVGFPSHDGNLPSRGSGFSSLAKYRVDRTKQEAQKNKEKTGFLETAQTQRFQPQLRPANPLGNERFFDYQQAEKRDEPEARFEEEHKLRLEEYYEKQRQLELLKKQREQLLLEQREIKRQQELLRLQQLVQRQQPSTTSKVTPASSSLASSPSSITNFVTTVSPLLLSSPTARRITPAESELFLKAIATHQKKFTTTTTTTTAKPTTKRVASKTSPETNGEIPKDLLSLIQAQQPELLAAKNKAQIKIIYQTERPETKQPPSSLGPSSTENENLLKQLKLALAQSAESDEKNITTRDLVLPNGKKLKVVKSANGLSSIVPKEGVSQFQTVTQALESSSPGESSTTTTTTTIRPAKAILDELTKGVLPPGADFEVLRHKEDGKLEQVGKSPINSQPGKKVTFVVLEEQPDGSYKVQGVKGNADKENNSPDVDSIVEKIKKGELKLPPRSTPTSTASSVATSVIQKKESTSNKSTVQSSTTRVKESSTVPTTFRPTTVKYSQTSYASTNKETSSSPEYSPYVTVSPNSISSSDNYVTSASTTSAQVYNTLVNSGSSLARNPSSRYQDEYTSRYTTANLLQSSRPVPNFSQFPDVTSTTIAPRTTSYVHFGSSPSSAITNPSFNLPSSSPSSSPSGASENLVIDDFQLTRSTLPTFLETSQNTLSSLPESMVNLLRREGLFAMAKYLRQSGLDSVLNETGPYTVFVPTDKAFRTLLVQLGGPDKAEQKFRENPRLLSGLLLHHVIPGAFRIDSLQDEMTGVSLAGTQLRVNVYDMHDHEWNDVKVTTINGAKVAPNKRDLEIPQGIAHAVDRVMFPLPVGDLIQTLQADRERRFTTLLKIIHASGLEDTLTGTKTLTVFAPTDAAFANVAAQNGRPVWIESDGTQAAKDIVSKHIIPTTLFTSGMRYYHQRDTLRPHLTLSIQKNGGRVKVNEAQVVTHNVPATNGVIHAIDGVL